MYIPERKSFFKKGNEFIPVFVFIVLLKTIFPTTFFTVKIIVELELVIKVIFVEFVNGFGAADKPSKDFSCEKPINETLNNKIKSIFLSI